MVITQTITAIYDNGVLTPIEKVRLRKRQKVRVKISSLNGHKRKRLASSRRPRKYIARDKAIQQRVRESFGMWKDREDIGDAVEWINSIRAGWEERLNELYKDG